jgi:hypothetical protein
MAREGHRPKGPSRRSVTRPIGVIEGSLQTMCLFVMVYRCWSTWLVALVYCSACRT